MFFIIPVKAKSASQSVSHYSYKKKREPSAAVWAKHQQPEPSELLVLVHDEFSVKMLSFLSFNFCVYEIGMSGV